MTRDIEPSPDEMIVPHTEECRAKRSHPDMRDYCECGSAEIQGRLDRLEEERSVIQRLLQDAETITIEGTGKPYTPRMVNASDLEDALAGRLR